jgi:hypothetical protein
MWTDLDTLAAVATLGVACDEGVGDAAGQQAAKQSAQLQAGHAERCGAGISHALGLRNQPTTQSRPHYVRMLHLLHFILRRESPRLCAMHI